MSHKNWYAEYNKEKEQFEVKGIPIDDGEYVTEATCVGPFRTKRGANYTAKLGFLLGSIEETEEAAKRAENLVPVTPGVVEKLLTVGDMPEIAPLLLTPKTVPSITAPFCDETMPKEVSSTFLATMVAHMIG